MTFPQSITLGRDLPRSTSGGIFRFSERGFTLVELLTVMAVMGIMTSLLAVSVSNFQSTNNRKRAVNILMETLEQARLTALQSGQKISVVFAKASDSTQGEDALIVTGEPPLGSPNPKQVLYARWTKLPSGICFRNAGLGTSAAPDSTVLQGLPPLKGTPTFSCVVFNSAGQVESPVNGQLKIALFEGKRQNGQEQATSAASSNGLYEIVSITRFTGRSQFNIGSLD
jgi:prepilin-type N-terminal cleavage/methylation domain-containing protein